LGGLLLAIVLHANDFVVVVVPDPVDLHEHDAIHRLH